MSEPTSPIVCYRCAGTGVLQDLEAIVVFNGSFYEATVLEGGRFAASCLCGHRKQHTAQKCAEKMKRAREEGRTKLLEDRMAHRPVDWFEQAMADREMERLAKEGLEMRHELEQRMRPMSIPQGRPWMR